MKRPDGFDRERERERRAQAQARAAARPPAGEPASPAPAPVPLAERLRRRRAPRAAQPTPSPGPVGPGVGDEGETAQLPELAVPADPARPADPAASAHPAPLAVPAPSAPSADVAGAGRSPGAAGSAEPTAGELLRAEMRGTDARAQLRAATKLRQQRERTERRRFTSHLRRRRRPWLIAGGAVLALALFVGVGVFTPLMGVREVRIEGTNRVDPAALQEALAGQLGTPLALVDQGAVRSALNDFPLLQEYAVETVPPHTLLVRVTERRPVITVTQGEEFALLDPAGVVISATPERAEGFPLAEGKAAKPGSPAFEAATLALQDLPDDLLNRFVSITASTPQDVRMVDGNGLEVIWGSPDDSAVKAVLLRSMLQALGDRPVSTIDVSSTTAPVFS